MSDLFYIVSLPQPKVTSSNISEIITSHLGKQAGLSGVPNRNNLIGEIRSWGPLFRVSFDLNIKSFDKGYSNIIAFKGNGARNDQGNDGDRIPKITLYGPNRFLEITNSVSGSGHYIYITEKKFALDNWYNIEIEQKEVSGKVRIVLSPSIVHLLDNCMSGILHNYD